MELSKLPPKDFFNTDIVKDKFKEVLGKKSTSFITSILQIIASSDKLSKTTPDSIYNVAMVAATLDLPLNGNLGFAYIIPFTGKDGITVAQFQLGYRGFIQLAQRSGQFKSIYASEIYEGQIVDENPLDGYVFDFSKKVSEKVIGYAARFKLLNGYEATYYMSVLDLDKHAKKYSQTYKKYSTGLWKDDFSAMAKKTVLKLLLSKFAPLSIDMQKAQIVDQAIINDPNGNNVIYIDNTEVVDKDNERLILMIKDCETIEQLNLLEEHILTDDARLLFNNKKILLKHAV